MRFTLENIAQGSHQLDHVLDWVGRTGTTSIRQLLDMPKTLKTAQDIKPELVSPPCTQQSCWNALSLLVSLLRARVDDDPYVGADEATVGPFGVFLARLGILEAYDLVVAAGADSIWLLSTIPSSKKLASLLGPSAPPSMVDTLWRGVLAHRRAQRREARRVLDPDATESDDEALSGAALQQQQKKKRARSDVEPAPAPDSKRPTLCLNAGPVADE